MAAITPTEVSYGDIPQSIGIGTGKKRVLVTIRAAAGSAGSTVNLATYVPGAADVEGAFYETDGDAVEGTASTWSTTTVTISSGAAGAYEGGFIVTTT